MFCDHCGAQLRDDTKFCHSCGKPVGGVAPLAPGRVRGHLRLLGILWVVISLFRLIPVGAMFLFGTMGFPHVHFGHMNIVRPMMFGFGGLLAIVALAGFLTGWGLLDRQPWARTLALILGFLALLDVPFGTALGIYTLWVLLPSDSEREYRRISQGA